MDRAGGTLRPAPAVAAEGPVATEPAAARPAAAEPAEGKPAATGEGLAARGVGPWSTRCLKE